MNFKADVREISSLIKSVRTFTVSSPNNAGCVFSRPPSLIRGLSKFIEFNDSKLTLSLEDIPIDFCPLIKTLSAFEFIIILSEFIIIWGLMYDEGPIGLVGNDLNSSFAILQLIICWFDVK